MTRTREQIKKDVIDQLYWDDRVNAADVTVEIEDNRALLRGSVPTLSARDFAAADALMVPGVSVVDNQLKVRYPTSVTAPSDTQIQSNVQNLLQWDSAIDAEHIRARVEQGIVTLEGSVDALWKKVHAEEIVANLTGVTAIDNQLTCVPTKDTSDEIIADLVVSALGRTRGINTGAIGVTVANGVVRLTGAVAHRSARDAALKVALHTFGAIGVDDQLVTAE